MEAVDVLELGAVTPRLDGCRKDQHQLVYHTDGNFDNHSLHFVIRSRRFFMSSITNQRSSLRSLKHVLLTPRIQSLCR